MTTIGILTIIYLIGLAFLVIPFFQKKAQKKVRDEAIKKNISPNLLGFCTLLIIVLYPITTPIILLLFKKEDK